MITSTIGKIFLDAYNEKNSTRFDAKTFFVEVYHPLFFDSNKYLQWVQNSPFVQMKKGQKVETLTPEERKEKLKKFIAKVDECQIPDASIAPGYPASEEKEFATTSGQVTNLNFSTSKDDIYLSWIGSSLAIGMTGGYLLLSNPSILLDLFDGWKWYRNAVDSNDKLKGNQINSWNGQWLVHRYDKYVFHPEQPMAGLDYELLFETTKEGMIVSTLSWTLILIAIAKQFKNAKLMGYFYGFDTNRKLPITFGFIPIDLIGIRRPIDLYKKLFGMNNNEDNKAERLWGTAYSLKESCKLGVIGTKAMQPEGLMQYMTADKNNDVKLPKYKDDDTKQTINFKTYQIWLLAMLNNQELWDKSHEFAKVLYDFVKKDKSISTQKKNITNSILSATSKKVFISSLGDLASGTNDVESIEEIAKIVHLMPSDNVPYFLTLIRFHYAIINK